MKLLNKFSGVQAVFFPVGTLENDGTCEFATGECLIKCAAIANGTNENKIPFEKKEAIYNYFQKWPILDICNQIIKELQKCDHSILYWFASGDCPSIMTKKIASIINLLDDEWVRQCGFTRNEKLMKSIKNKNNIVLTVENKGQIRRLQEYVRLFGIPNFETGDVEIYKVSKKRSSSYVSYTCARPSSCTPSSALNFGQPSHTSHVVEGNATYTSELLDTHNNCRECFDKHIGCFCY